MQSAQVTNVVLALAVGREVIEIEVPDTTLLDTLPEGEGRPTPGHTPLRRYVRIRPLETIKSIFCKYYIELHKMS